MLIFQDPTSNADFTTVISPSRISEIDDGHQCYVVPDPSSNITAGMNATFQIKYTSEFDSNENQTFYACADITYVLEGDFRTEIPCFNASIPSPSPTTSSGSSGSSATSSSSSVMSSSGSSSGLSGGAIAGIVVGVVGGLGLIGVIAFLYWRVLQQKKRLQQQEASVRSVKWERDAASAGSSTDNPDSGIAMQNLR